MQKLRSIRQWAEEHQAPLDLPPDYLEPPDMEDVYPVVPLLEGGQENRDRTRIWYVEERTRMG